MVTLSLLYFSLIIRSLKKSGFFLSRCWFWAGHIMMMLSHKTKNQTNIISLQTSLMIIWPNNQRKHPVFMLHTPSQTFSSLSKFIVVVVGWSVQLFNNSSKCRLPAPFCITIFKLEMKLKKNSSNCNVCTVFPRTPYSYLVVLCWIQPINQTKTGSTFP